MKPDPGKIKAISNYSRPRNIREPRSFLGLVNYCRDFVKKFAQFTSKLNDLLKGKNKKSTEKINWDENLSLHSKIARKRWRILHSDVNQVFRRYLSWLLMP